MRIYLLVILLCLAILFIPKYSEAQTAPSDDTAFKQTIQLLEKHFSKVGDILFDQGNYIPAINNYDKALSINSTDSYVLYKKAQVYDKLGQYASAISYYDKALVISPDYTDALYGKGIALEQLGEKDSAIQYYKKVLEINPNDAAASAKLNLIFNNTNTQTIPTNETLDNQTIPTNETLDNQTIPTNETLDNQTIPTNETLAILSSQALENQFFKAGNSLFNAGNYTDAITYYDKALQINSTNIETLYDKALALDNLGKLDDAITYYDKVLTISPNDTDALNNKGLALDNLGKHDQAITYFDKVLTINPEDPDALYNKGHVLDEMGEKNNATAYYKKVLEINPNDAAASAKLNLTFNNANKTFTVGTQKVDQAAVVVVGLFILILITIIAIDLISKRRNKTDGNASTVKNSKADQNLDN